MEPNPDSRDHGSNADYLAAERTFLAWIRTGIALMGFGFVVARFGLFLEALSIGQPNLHLRSFGESFWFGTVLILAGVAVNIASVASHIQITREIRRGQLISSRPSTLAISVAAVMAIFGLAMAIYLVLVRDPAPGRSVLNQEKSMIPNSDNGIVTIASRQSVDAIVQKFEKILRAKGVKLFALVDHSGEAEKAGMQMRPTKLLIFGNPKAGTPLMLASPSIAIDLPLKILVAEDANGQVQVSYNSPAWLQARHGLPAELLQNIAVVDTLAAKAAE
jgi:uncharacterized protein (DUF302 family)/uncharacterized membrane protein YidH (DUF202 family)